jgi:hypothetical protein
VKTVTFREACTIYPDGKTPDDVAAGFSRDLEDAYADLIVAKGHAGPVTPLPGVAAPFQLDLSPAPAPAITSPTPPGEATNAPE